MARVAIEDRLAMVEYAVNRLKEVGFVHAYSSMKSEACYYKMKDVGGVMRVAVHKFNRTKDKAIESPVRSCLTFGDSIDIRSQGALDTMIANAVGRYIMAGSSGTADWRAAAGRRNAARTIAIPTIRAEPTP